MTFLARSDSVGGDDGGGGGGGGCGVGVISSVVSMGVGTGIDIRRDVLGRPGTRKDMFTWLGVRDATTSFGGISLGSLEIKSTGDG